MGICNLDHFATWPGGRAVLVSGAFDPLHRGHLDHFYAARQFGGSVVCAVSSDAEVAAKRVPLQSAEARAQVLNDLRVLDHVHVTDARGVVPVLEALRPRAYVTGADWKDRLPLAIIEACARLVIAIEHTDVKTGSSTAILDDYQRRLNAEKLADFEAWASTQPDPPPWTPVTDYSFEARRDVEGPHAALIAKTFAPDRVLDYGCGYGHLVKMMREEGVTANGWDPQFLQSPPEALRICDLVICREVLEHVPVRDLRSTLRNIVALSSRFVYVTTRFTSKPHLLDFDTRDDLDPTHVTMLNQDYLRSLFVLEGCARRADLEARMDHRGLNRVLVYEVPQ